MPRRAAAGAIDLLVIGGGRVGMAGAIGVATGKWHGNGQPGWMTRWMEGGGPGRTVVVRAR